MATIQSLGQIQNIQPSWTPGRTFSSVRLYDRYNYEYAALYRMQPNIRTCVDFLARNIAQLGLHVFRRVDDTDRVRLIDHPLVSLLGRPLPPEYKVTRYKLINSLVSDLGIYFNAYWLKLEQNGEVWGLLRVPPAFVTPIGGLIVKLYEINIAGKRYEIPIDRMVHISGYNAENPFSGLSPLETLRNILAEEHAAGKYREEFWQNSARMQGFVKRPIGAPDWTDGARERWLEEFTQLYSGEGSSGKTAVLEEGMEWESMTYNAQEAQYLEGRKLTREECARGYHIPPPMVGILDRATFSNIESQHKSLYTDTLGPWLSMIEQDIELQLLTDFDDTKGIYVEFNIQEKLQGDFNEQAKVLQSAVGRPWMTADEARARMNLPKIGGEAELLVTPLNVIAGGLASPRDTAPKRLEPHNTKGFDSQDARLRERFEQRWTEVLTSFYRRQEAAVVSKLPKALSIGEMKSDIGMGIWWDDERWNAELFAGLYRLNHLTSVTWANRMAELMETEVSEDRMLAWLEEHSRIQTENINQRTRDEIMVALNDPEPLEAVKYIFGLAFTVWAGRQAVSSVTTCMNFGANEAANAAGRRTKTWRVNSSNPRASHAAMHGETVAIKDLFSNGMRWPGDPAGGADEVANCYCTVEFN